MAGRAFKAQRLGGHLALTRGRAQFRCMIFNAATRPRPFTAADGGQGTYVQHAAFSRWGPVYKVTVWEYAYEPPRIDRMLDLDIDTPI